MWTSGVIEGQISTDACSGLRHGFVGVEIDLLIFDRPPKPLDEDIVSPCALAVHRDGDFSLLQYRREVDGCELGPLDALLRVKQRSGLG